MCNRWFVSLQCLAHKCMSFQAHQLKRSLALALLLFRQMRRLCAFHLKIMHNYQKLMHNAFSQIEMSTFSFANQGKRIHWEQSKRITIGVEKRQQNETKKKLNWLQQQSSPHSKLKNSETKSDWIGFDWFAFSISLANDSSCHSSISVSPAQPAIL